MPYLLAQVASQPSAKSAEEDRDQWLQKEKLYVLATFASLQPFFIACASEILPGWVTSSSAAQSMNGSMSDMAGRG